MKKMLLDYITSLDQYDVVDHGCSNSTDSVDYPNFSQKVCAEVTKDPSSHGVLVCGTGIGIGIAANKVKVNLFTNSKI